MKVSKFIAALTAVSCAAAMLVVPVQAGTLEQDKAWVEAQAAAGLKK